MCVCVDIKMISAEVSTVLTIDNNLSIKWFMIGSCFIC